MSSMFGKSGGGGLGGSSLRLSGQSTGGMMNDDALGLILSHIQLYSHIVCVCI